MDHNYTLSRDLEQNSSTALDPINMNLLYGLGNVNNNNGTEESFGWDWTDDNSFGRMDLPKGKFKSVNEALPFVLRRLPLVTEKADDLTYSRLHPYVARTTEQFLSWNVGKRLSCEVRLI